MIIYIFNQVKFHYEVILSVIEKYDLIIKQPKTSTDIIYLSYIDYDQTYTQYLHQTYPKIKIGQPANFDYSINCTIYPNFGQIKNNGKNFYIAHELSPIFNQPNITHYIYYLTPLCQNLNYFYYDRLPFRNQTKQPNKIPVFVIQGNIESYRRNFDLLELLLEYSEISKLPFKVKVLGRGHLDSKFNRYSSLIQKNDLNFIDFHHEFLDCDYILPMITQATHPHYYTTKLTSSIVYGLAYNLHFVIDQDLQNIYNVPKATIFTDTTDFISSFEKTLKSFYNIV